MSEFQQPNPNEQEEKPQQTDQKGAEFTDEESDQAMDMIIEMMKALKGGNTDRVNNLADQIKGSSIGKKIGYDK